MPVCPPGVEVPSEERVGDGIDNDCDGLVDEHSHSACGCLPGARRWCDNPDYGFYGEQYCGEGGEWERCLDEVATPPAECAAVESWYSPAFETCLIEAGLCAQDMWDLDNDGDSWESLGDCTGIVCL